MAEGLEPRDRRAAAAEPVLGEQGGRRSAGVQLLRHLRRAGHRHARVEQLRAVPVSREDHPAVRDQRDRRACRCRSTAMAATSATGCTWTTTAARCELLIEHGVSGEIYNVGGGNEIRNVDLTHTHPGRRRPAADARAAGEGSARATTGGTRSTPRRPRALGWAPTVPFADGLRATIDWYRGQRVVVAPDQGRGRHLQGLLRGAVRRARALAA